ncbi:MAG TPA: cell envelope integrity protein TolA [Xanthobacteraceae bacterium]
MRSDWVISGAGHLALLVAGLVTLANSKPIDDPADYVPVSIVTDADVSRAALGQKNAPLMPRPKPLADKIGELKQVDQIAPKVTDKPAITTSSPTPMPMPKPESKPAPKTDPKTAQQKPDPKKTDDFKADKIAELLKKTTPPKPKDKPTSAAPKYDANQIAQLLDHREVQRQVATADTLNGTAGLGAASASPNAQLSQSEIDALRERIRDCWSPPPGIDANTNIYISLRVLFKPDGSLAQMPVIVAGSASPMGPALAESGKRALLMCQPFTMLKPEHYAQWKDITVDFNPRDLSN